jgi:uncharacterized protein YbbK (DUF523 family)
MHPIDALPTPTPEAPLRILLSHCLTGALCGFDGSNFGGWPLRERLLSPKVRLFSFCPEEVVFGTPRELFDLHGGDGFDVLDGKARAITTSGQDVTMRMMRGAEQMLALARQQNIQLAIMMDISPSCGSQVIYDGDRALKKYQRGSGITAALLRRNGFLVIAQRDAKSIEHLLVKLDPGYTPNPDALDHNETPFYKTYFQV